MTIDHIWCSRYNQYFSSNFPRKFVPTQRHFFRPTEWGPVYKGGLILKKTNRYILNILCQIVLRPQFCFLRFLTTHVLRTFLFFMCYSQPDFKLSAPILLRLAVLQCSLCLKSSANFADKYISTL